MIYKKHKIEPRRTCSSITFVVMQSCKNICEHIPLYFVMCNILPKNILDVRVLIIHVKSYKKQIMHKRVRLLLLLNGHLSFLTVLIGL